MLYKRNSILLVLYELGILIRQYLLLYIFIITINSIWGNKTFFRITLWYIVITFLLNIIKKLYDWFAFKYLIQEDNIQIITGFFLHNYKTIHLAKVQQVNVKQNIIYRALKKEFVEIDMGADSDEGKVILKMIEQNEGKVIKDIVKNVRVKKYIKRTINTSFEKTIYESNVKEVFLMSIITAQMLFILPLAYTLYNKYGENYFLKRFINEISLFLSKSFFNQAIIGIIIMLLAITYGFIISYIKYGKYKVIVDKKDLIIQSGFIHIKNKIIAKENIKALLYSRPFIFKFFGLVRVKVFLSSGKFKNEKDSDIIIPIIGIQKINRIINRIDQRYEHTKEFEKTNLKLLVFYSFFLSFLLLLVPILNIKYIILLCLILFSFILRIINNRIEIDSKKENIYLKTGVFKENIYVVKKENIEIIEERENPIKKIAGLTTLHIFIRKSPVKCIKIININKNKSDELMNMYNNVSLIQKK